MEQIAYNQEVNALLIDCDLPVADLRAGGDVCFLGYRPKDTLIGVIGLEVCGDVGLLRSLSVSTAHRGNGLGQQLVADAETWATHANLKALYLLTDTAARFFERLGYKELARSEAPGGIIETAQFTELCPASATFMRKRLSADQAVYRAGL